MSQKSKNGNILSFFKPMNGPPHVDTSQSTKSQPPPRSSTPPLSASQSFSSPLALRSTPQKPSSTLPVEIGASDEEGDVSSSDDSFADLTTLIGKKQPKAPTPTRVPHKHHVGPFTPSAKRTALELDPSPIPIKHKFDLKALAKDARLDDATTASSIRNQDAELAQASTSKAEQPRGSRSALVDIVRAEGGSDAEKVLRVVNRADRSLTEEVYAFFQRDWKAPGPSEPPKGLEKTPWRILTLGSPTLREQHLVSGIAYTLSTKLSDGIPDELFDWMLDEICTSSSPLVREEYRNLMLTSNEKIRALVTPAKLEVLFRKAGVDMNPRIQEYGLTSIRVGETLYGDRDWSQIKSLLTLLSFLSSNLSAPSLEYATLTLLRMSMDRAVLSDSDLLSEYDGAISLLSDAFSPDTWKSFLTDVLSSKFNNTLKNQIRVHAVLCLPVSNQRTHDLRRQLASMFLFDGSRTAVPNSTSPITIEQAIERLAKDDFQIFPGTDFAELRANVLLLDVLIGDGSVPTVLSPEDERLFNERVDELAVKLREIWKRINDAGMKLARTEAKSVIEWVQQRLSYSVRTKRKLKKSVFDMPEHREDKTLPQRQEFMKNFLNKPTLSS